ncbi:SH3 domain-containing protein [Devosia sp.]|uniref:SH3 domain-containing protein n=1 Tax=Devosia sp. TaxID=1871048 RepID=UPI00260E4DB7|nr:SH3 domain-containing protein [Devosia sp.]
MAAKLEAQATVEAPAHAVTAAVVAASAVAVAPEAPAMTKVAMTKPALSDTVVKAQRVDKMIGATFTALAADDAGWLAGAAAVADAKPVAAPKPVPTTDAVAEAKAVATTNAAADPETYAEGDGTGPQPQQVASTGETAREAVTAAAVDETPGQPLQRPKPLEVAAFVEERVDTPPAVKAEAQKQLVAVAKPEAVEKVAPAAEPTPAPKAAAAPVKAKPAKAAPAPGDTRTVAGQGVNVRAGPGKSQGKLFALAGGEKVKVSENQRGWLRVTDDQGRTGWVYKTYVY